jgi:hypothetical protein
MVEAAGDVREASQCSSQSTVVMVRPGSAPSGPRMAASAATAALGDA